MDTLEKPVTDRELDLIVNGAEEEDKPCHGVEQNKPCPHAATTWTLWTCTCHLNFCDAHQTFLEEHECRGRVACGKHDDRTVYIAAKGPL